MNDVALKDYLEDKINSLDQRIKERFILNDQALSKAETAMSARLNTMNEFRDALKDQSSLMATRSELNRVEQLIHKMATCNELKTLEAKVGDLEKRRANLDGRLFAMAAFLSIFVSSVVALILQSLK